MKIEYRVKKADEFQKIMNARHFKNSKSFTVYYDHRKEEHSRYGIAVSKKLGNAVLRNKTKRQVRSMLQDINPFEGNFDGIILVRKKYFDQSFEDNRKDLEKLLKTVKM